MECMSCVFSLIARGFVLLQVAFLALGCRGGVSVKRWDFWETMEMEPPPSESQVVVASDQRGLGLQVLQPGMVPCEVCGATCSKRLRVSGS